MIPLYVAAGGAAGAIARYGVGRWLLPTSGFPWATLLVNVAGSLLLGVVMRALPDGGAAPAARALLAIGFCGSFTTFSTFGYETVSLWTGGAPQTAAAYAAASLVLGLAAVVAGLWLGGLVP